MITVKMVEEVEISIWGEKVEKPIEKLRIVTKAKFLLYNSSYELTMIDLSLYKFLES